MNNRKLDRLLKKYLKLQLQYLIVHNINEMQKFDSYNFSADSRSFFGFALTPETSRDFWRKTIEKQVSITSNKLDRSIKIFYILYVIYSI